MINVLNKKFAPYISSAEIANAVQRISSELMETHANSSPYFLGVLNGSFMFFSDLMKEFSAPCEIGFIKAASYEGMSSTGKVSFQHAGKLDLENRAIVIVEDIVDTGNTLDALLNHLKEFNPKSIQICTLLFKREAYCHSHPIDYVCFEVENKFLLGYGLDFDGFGRNLSEVYILNE